MAITREHNAFIVSIRRRGRGHLRPPPLIGAAPTRDEARALENQMIQALRDGLPWPAQSPAQGTLAAALSYAWGRPEGWHTLSSGAELYAHALDFVTFMGADSMVDQITQEGLKAYLEQCTKARLTTRAVFQLLQAASESGATSWRPVRRKGPSEVGHIQLLQQRVTTRTKIVRATNPTKSGPLWEMVEVKSSKWA